MNLYTGMVRAMEAKKGNHAVESCAEEDHGRLAALQAKMAVLDVKCEEMCKKMDLYPKCQCPGFEGNPPTDDDTRKCMTQYCQDPSTPCPTEGFVTCVKETTTVSALQWDSLLQRFDSSMNLYTGMVRAMEAQTSNHTVKSCAEEDHGRLAALQAKMAVLDVKCEEMCKKLGEYPKCQCPGFEGNPPTDDDTRKCMTQYCQDPSTPCPTEGFVTCVKEATAVSALQWGSLFERLSTSL